MRYVYLAVLLLLVVVIGVFIWQNLDAVELWFFGQKLYASLALIVGAAYVLGMFTGWTVIGIVRKSVARVTEPGRPPQ